MQLSRNQLPKPFFMGARYIMTDKIPHPCNSPGCNQPTLKRFCNDCNSAKPERSKWYTSYEWRQIKKAHLAEHPLCQCANSAYCEHEPGECLSNHQPEVDHIVPISKGGNPRARANLQTLCKSCHSKKTRQEMAGQASMHSYQPLSNYIKEALDKEKRDKPSPETQTG